MFAQVNEVKDITGKNVDVGIIQRAQYVVEAYIGKFETDVSNDNDLEICKRAVAYQSAYMLNNEDVVFEQMAVSTTGINDSYTTFRQNDLTAPFIAPMAVMICQKLSFVKTRSVYTGKTFQETASLDWTTL